MIARLRRRRRSWIAGIAFAAPAVLALGLIARPTEPSPHALPAAFRSTDGAAPLAEARELPGLWGALPIHTRATPTAVEPEALEDLRVPEPLVYCAPAGAPIDVLPETATLLGRLAGTGVRRFALPAPHRDSGGTLLLYSLGHGAVIAGAALPLERAAAAGDPSWE